jgi:hypothetical protein
VQEFGNALGYGDEQVVLAVDLCLGHTRIDGDGRILAEFHGNTPSLLIPLAGLGRQHVHRVDVSQNSLELAKWTSPDEMVVEILIGKQKYARVFGLVRCTHVRCFL